MNALITPSENNLNQNNLFETLYEYEDYYLVKDKNAYKVIIGKLRNEIVIRCKNYEIKLNNKDLTILTKSVLNTIEEAYQFIINIFEQNKVIIKDININKTINLLLKIYIFNIEKDIEIILVYNKQNKDLIINELNNNYNLLKNDINNLKNEIEILKKEINIIKVNESSNLLVNNEKLKKENYSNPKEIKFLKNLTNDSYCEWDLDNTFTLFKSIDEILYLIYATENKSIISYNLINDKKVKEIKKAHEKYITNFRYYLDKINQRDLIITVSSDDNNVKIWNAKNWDCILNLKNVNKYPYLNSVCFINDNNQNYIITSNCNWGYDSESIKVFNFNGNKIKEINDSKDKVLFLDSYYDNKLSQNYIISANKGDIKSFNYNENKIYHRYFDNDEERHNSIVINFDSKLTKLIESSEDGNIRVWDFHSGELMNKIKISSGRLYGLCLWNNDYLFIGCFDETIKILELNSGIIIKNLEGHNNKVLTIKKIIHPKYGQCLISSGVLNESI